MSLWVVGFMKLSMFVISATTEHCSKPIEHGDRRRCRDPLVSPSSNLEGKTYTHRLGMPFGSAKSLVDPKSDALSYTHDGIVPIYAHCSSLWLACFVETPRGVVTL